MCFFVKNSRLVLTHFLVLLFCFVAAVLPFMIGSVSASLSDGASNACVLTGGDGSL